MSLPIVKRIDDLISDIKNYKANLVKEFENIVAKAKSHREGFEITKGATNAPNESFVQELESKVEELKSHIETPAIAAAPVTTPPQPVETVGPIIPVESPVVIVTPPSGEVFVAPVVAIVPASGATS